MSALAIQLIEHPVWERASFGWVTGMVDFEGDPLVASNICTVHLSAAYSEPLEPDIEHPATKGVLLDQCRRMAGERGMMTPNVIRGPSRRGLDDPLAMPRLLWGVHPGRNSNTFDGDKYATEGEAIARCWLWLANMMLAEVPA